MDTKKGIKNVIVSITFKIILLVSSIFVRNFLIRYIGNDINGLNSLYISLIGFLSVAELGVGSAITFCMYKPIVEGDNSKVAALYQLFKKLYLIICGAIFAIGMAMMPFLQYIVKDYSSVNVNIYFTFFLIVISVVVSYLFSAKTSLINAYKNNYITTTITSLGMLLQHVLQLIVLVKTASFEWYLVCRIISIVVQWVATEFIVRKQHNDILKHEKVKLDNDTKARVVTNIKAMFMHRVGSVLVNSVDSVIISSFIGIVVLGLYSNYITIVNNVVAVISLFFTPFIPIIGHYCVKKESALEGYYSFFHSFNFILGVIFFLGYYATIDNIITILFGDGLIVPKAVSLVITLNYFIQFMRQSTLLFRDAMGLFYNDRWKPIVEGVANTILSIAFVLLFRKIGGEAIEVVGVVVATIITNLLVCHVIEPYVLYKNGFDTPVRKFYFKNYAYMVAFAVVLLIMDKCMLSFSSQWKELLINGSISVLFSIAITAIIVFLDANFRRYLIVCFRKINIFKKKN